MDIAPFRKICMSGMTRIPALVPRIAGVALLGLALACLTGLLGTDSAITWGLLALSGILAIGFAAVLGALKRLDGGLARLASDMEVMVTEDQVLELSPATDPRMDPLVSAMNDFVHTLASREERDQELLASNKILGRQQDSLLKLLDSLHKGLVVVDGVGRLIFANQLSSGFLAVSADAARGLRVDECLADTEVKGLIDRANGADSGPRSQSTELRRETGSNAGDWFVSRHSVCDKNNALAGQILWFDEITKIKASERSQVEFLDSLAHEFRTPLTSILAYTEMLMDGDAADPETSANFYNIIYEESHRLSQLIDNLLNISRLESGTTTLNPTPTRLKKLLESSLDLVRPQAEKKRVELAVDIPDRLPTLNIDKGLFSVAIVNILGNAVKYTPEGGRVTLSTTSREKEFLVEIHDTGVGIGEDDLEKIFEKFYRCPDAAGSETSGSGVGLATALRIVDVHGGEIRVASKPGEGSRFSIVLPRTLINTTMGD